MRKKRTPNNGNNHSRCPDGHAHHYLIDGDGHATCQRKGCSHERDYVNNFFDLAIGKNPRRKGRDITMVNFPKADLGRAR